MSAVITSNKAETMPPSNGFDIQRVPLYKRTGRASGASGGPMKIALAQRNYIVADLAGNAERIAAAVRDAQARGAGLVITSELALLGYPPRDLLLQPAFVARSWEVLEQLAEELRAAPPVLVGIAEPNPSAQGPPAVQ